MSTIPDSQVVAVSDKKVDGAIRKAKNRLVPMIIIMDLIAYIDRANIGFAALRRPPGLMSVKREQRIVIIRGRTEAVDKFGQESNGNSVSAKGS